METAADFIIIDYANVNVCIHCGFGRPDGTFIILDHPIIVFKHFEQWATPLSAHHYINY